MLQTVHDINTKGQCFDDTLINPTIVCTNFSI